MDKLSQGHGYSNRRQINKEGCTVVSILLRAEFGLKDNREDAPHFMSQLEIVIIDFQRGLNRF